ncbi:hypothetical protein BpHYR1_019403 [Brachionus plicatilis]|uniref:Uncharacterized protein n=1 Tax=Brachionus plicatilis TaxID=10195 RepID=A0A3M7SNZ9_BRAPC|nr:hypothetical protein BpHYR1_019403 [Brachionus plicatilis]
MADERVSNKSLIEVKFKKINNKIYPSFINDLIVVEISEKLTRTFLTVKLNLTYFFSNFNFCVEKKSFCAERFEIVLNDTIIFPD